MYASSMAGGEWSRAIAVAAFVASYVGLGLGRVPPFRVDRTGVAIIGAAAMVASGALPWPAAAGAVPDRARDGGQRRERRAAHREPPEHARRQLLGDQLPELSRSRGAGGGPRARVRLPRRLARVPSPAPAQPP